MRFKDKNSGIEFGINYEAIESESQKKAVEDFVFGLRDSLDAEPVKEEEDSIHIRIKNFKDIKEKCPNMRLSCRGCPKEKGCEIPKKGVNFI